VTVVDPKVDMQRGAGRRRCVVALMDALNCLYRGQIARASSVNAAATRTAGVASIPSS
jgi:hypothetical protein